MFLTVRNSKVQGYTLIEMALALMVIGILLAGFLAIYTQYQTEEKISKTTNRVNSAIASIQKYRSVYGAFPCPAPMNAARIVATYGVASNYTKYLPSGTVPLLAGECAEGICIEQNIRSDLSGTPTLRVRVGAIPFRDMQLDESDTYDAYGSRLWYAVTEDLCNLPTFNETRGAINIINDQNETQTDPANSAAFIVISPGINKVGGYGLEGTLQTLCTTTPTPESENCRDVSLATSATTSATYRAQLVQEGNVNAYFDDVVEFFSAAQTQLWRRTAPGEENILDLANNSIGIGVSSPSATLDIAQSAVSTLAKPVSPALPVPGVYYQGDVTPTNVIAPNREHGALRVVGLTSQLKSDVYCSQAGDNCFRPENIKGVTGIDCPAGSYPVGIESDPITHDAKFTCTPIAISCPPGQTFAGFSTSGGNLVPNCSSATSFSSCPATALDLCAVGDVSLPATAHNGWVYSGVKGSCREAYYSCNNGVWTQPWGGPWGSCVDTPTVTAGIACNSVDACWTGTYTLTTYSCSAGTWTFATDCTCTGCSRTVPSLCPSPLTGSGAVTRYDYVCDPSSPHSPAVVDPLHLAGTVITPSSCSCTLSPYNTFYDCPAGYIRDPSAPHLVPTDWPGDILKGRYELVNVDGSCTHVNSGTVIDHCSCDTADQYSTIEPPPPSCKKAQSGSRVVNGTSYDWKYEVRKTTINSAGCTPNPFTVESAAQFEDLDTYWREQAGSYSTTTSSKASSTPVVGERCDCGTQAGSTKACVKANPSGGWDVYQCQCGS